MRLFNLLYQNQNLFQGSIEIKELNPLEDLKILSPTSQKLNNNQDPIKNTKLAKLHYNLDYIDCIDGKTQMPNNDFQPSDLQNQILIENPGEIIELKQLEKLKILYQESRQYEKFYDFRDLFNILSKKDAILKFFSFLNSIIKTNSEYCKDNYKNSIFSELFHSGINIKYFEFISKFFLEKSYMKCKTPQIKIDIMSQFRENIGIIFPHQDLTDNQKIDIINISNKKNPKSKIIFERGLYLSIFGIEEKLETKNEEEIIKIDLLVDVQIFNSENLN